MRIFITGGTGLVGSNVIKVAREKYDAEIIASQYGPEPEWEVDYELAPLDMGDHEAVRAAVTQYKPDVVIHCAALLDQVFMVTHRAKSWSIMVEGTLAFAEACREVGSRFVFISSDWVFDGREPQTTEDSPPFPVNFYGVMKMASEMQLSQMTDLNYGVARLAGVYGLNYAIPSMTKWDQGLGFGDLPTYYVRQFVHNQPVDVWMEGNLNVLAHPTLASNAAEILMLLARHDGNGTFHCFGSEAIDRLDMAKRVAKIFNGDESLIREVPIDEGVVKAHELVPMPYKLNSSVDKTAEALGQRSFNVVEGLQSLKEQIEANDISIG